VRVRAKEKRSICVRSIRARRALRIYPELTYVPQAFFKLAKKQSQRGAFKRSKTKSEKEEESGGVSRRGKHKILL